MPRHANCLRSSPAARFARLRQRSGWGLLALLWIAAFSVQAQVSEAKVAALVEALRLSAPEAKPDAGLYGDWPVSYTHLDVYKRQTLEKS